MKMRQMFLVAGFVLLLGLGPVALATAGEGTRPKFFVDPRDGIIDGRAAVNIFPVDYGASEATSFLNPEGLEAHLTPVDDPNVERIYPAGSWFQPPPGRYRVWLEGDWRMSPYSMLLGYAGESSRASGVMGPIPIGGAGRVVLPSSWNSTSDQSLELLHAGDYLEGEFPRWEISRRTPAGKVGKGLLMPAGTAIGAIWDRRRRMYVAVSRPFQVREGKTVEVALERPQGLADLVVQLRRGDTPSTVADRDVDVTLKREARALPPDLKVLTADRVYAVWYDVEPGPAELHAESLEEYVTRQSLHLMAGQIERVACDLEPRPALDVELDLPQPLRAGKLALELRTLPAGEVVAHQAVPPDVDSIHFDRLPLELLEIVLGTDLGTFTQQVDLRSGGDGFVVLKPDLISVRGTVYRGKEGHRAKLTFTTVAHEAKEVQAGDDGAYEVVGLQPIRSVSVALEDSEEAPYVDVFWTAIARDRELDFHLPDVDFTARVLDATTGMGIQQAAVTIRNTFEVADEGPDLNQVGKDTEHERVISQSVVADETGVARLPPLRQGKVEIGASAEGYEELLKPVEAEVLDQSTAQEFIVRLQPIGSTESLRLRLPGGGPAAGAEVLLVDSLATGNALISAQADAEGRVDLPRNRAGSVVLIRHPQTAFLVREWLPHDGEDEVVADLPQAAGLPLLVAVKDASGERPDPQAGVALWVYGWRLGGFTLGWLTRTRPMADFNGFWTVTNLPPVPVEILVWGLRQRDEAAAGNLDSQAVGVAYPWPEPLEIRAID
jgi:hypothetical protein